MTASWVNRAMTSSEDGPDPASASSAAPTRTLSSARVSRPAMARVCGSSRHVRHSSGHRSAISASVSPSHGATRSSPKASFASIVRPRRVASGSAVCLARASGLDTIFVTPARSSAAAVASAASSHPSSIPMSCHPMVRSSRFQVVRPCRTRWIVVMSSSRPASWSRLQSPSARGPRSTRPPRHRRG